MHSNEHVIKQTKNDHHKKSAHHNFNNIN